VVQSFGANATYQFYRTGRWLGRLQAIYNGEHTPVGNSDEPLDYVLAFFLNCYHIKDWLKAGPEWREDVAPEVRNKAVEQFVEESEVLRICADLCNGNKHFRLKQAPRSGSAPELKAIHTKVDTSTDPQTKTTRYILRTERGDDDALQLATECFECWASFIRFSTAESLLDLAARNSKRKQSVGRRAN
jgi:hypothetical protein